MRRVCSEYYNFRKKKTNKKLFKKEIGYLEQNFAAL